ncbi:MAG TPA: M20/M25/M40 family metallo-hydrolase, partial [Candidatus Lokiarchaeia archaeon]|nr:M20/M25/M40 family metallo-hydrolase [Candidatus Lokiarchaeia archaeon]
MEPLVIKLLRDLVAFNTQNPPGNENEIIAYCEEFLAQRGFETQIRPVMEGRSNLVARWLPAGSETIDAPQLLFSGHVDTVPVGDITAWSYPPLKLTEDGGFLYGRGTCDMKGAVAAYLAVADGVAQGAADSPSPPFSIVLTADEETGFIGIESLAKDFPLTNVWGVILGEATGNTPVTGHKGVVWVRVTLHGTSAHASLPELGDNAILKAAKFINALTANFESMWIETYRHSDLGTPTLNVGKIAGGLKFNVIPDACEVWLDFRVPPPLDAAMVQSRLEQILAEMD